MAPIELQEGNIKVIVPSGYELIGEKHLEDIQYCYNLIPNFVGVYSDWDGIIVKIYISNDGTNRGSYNNGILLYKRSQENMDWDLEAVITNDPLGFLYASSPTYCSNTHEFTHHIVANIPIPSWANEGIAEYSQKFNQAGSKDNFECRDNGWYGRDIWETNEEMLFSYSDLSEYYSEDIPGGGPKWYHSAMCFWEAFDGLFGEEARKSAFRILRDKYTGKFIGADDDFRLLDGKVISIPYKTKFFIERVLFEVVPAEQLIPLLTKFGFEEDNDYNLY